MTVDIPTGADGLQTEIPQQPHESIIQAVERQDLKKVDHHFHTGISVQERKKIISRIDEEAIRLPYADVKGLDKAQHLRIQEILNAKLENLAVEMAIPVSASSKVYENEGRETLLEHEKAHIKKAEELCGTTWDDMFIFIFATTDKKGKHLNFGAMTSGFADKPGYGSLTRYQESLIDLAPREPAVSDYLYFCENFLAGIKEIKKTELAEIISIIESKPPSVGREETLTVVSQYKHL